MDRAVMLNEETNTTSDIASASSNDSDKTLRFTWTAVALDSTVDVPSLGSSLACAEFPVFGNVMVAACKI
jgi:hypothetical protein